LPGHVDFAWSPWKFQGATKIKRMAANRFFEAGFFMAQKKLHYSLEV